MKTRALISWYLALIGLLWLLPVLAMGSSCAPEEKTVISAEARCFENRGVDIGFMGEEGYKVACMRDTRVRSVCGPDGRVTRLNAYRQWLARLKEQESACAARGGTLHFENLDFVEPVDESFCMQAEPEVGATMFESATCNYRAVCPAVTVICETRCKTDRVVVTNTPAHAFPAEDENFLKRISARR